MEQNIPTKFFDINFNQTEGNSSFVKRLYICEQNGEGTVFLAEPYKGVCIWKNDIHMSNFSFENPKEGRYLRMNYCLSGRCEAHLYEERYTYISSGLLSIDTESPFGQIAFPTGEYTGLELALDLNMMKDHYPIAWKDCGLDLPMLMERLSVGKGSYLASVSSQWDQAARELTIDLESGRLKMEDCRFKLLKLIYMIKEGGHCTPVLKHFFLTPGQRSIVKRIEKLITKELSQRYNIAVLAKQYGISPSTLKKIFGYTYGKPISIYLREKRVEKAKQLLCETNWKIADVAAEVGYENQGKFSSVFRQATGVSPLEYRRLNRKETI